VSVGYVCARNSTISEFAQAVWHSRHHFEAIENTIVNKFLSEHRKPLPGTKACDNLRQEVLPEMASARIFIVDDNASDVFILRRALQDCGEEFELQVVPDGEEALEVVRAEKEDWRDASPCVMLLDLNLPRYTGVEILRAIQSPPAPSHVHVIMTSNGVSPEQLLELRRMGAEYREKPRTLAAYDELARYLITVCKSLRAHA
jgi:CheY-like chemotaxis protein